MVKEVLFSLVLLRLAGDRDGLHLTRAVRVWSWPVRLVVEFDKISDVKVQVTIVIDISEGRTHAPFGKVPMRIGHTRRPGHFSKSPVTVVAIELVGAIIGDIQIRIPIIVVIAHRTAAAPLGVSEMGFRGYVGEGFIAVVAKEVIVGKVSLLLGLARRPVHEINVLVAIIVIIKKAGTFAIDIDEELGHFISTNNLEGKPGLFRDVGESWRSEERRVGKECRSRWSPYH